MSNNTWLKMNEFSGGLIVFCTLCGKKNSKRIFHSGDTNYAEARRLATAYHWDHEHSDAHGAALAVFHADEPPALTAEVKVAYEIFGLPIPPERERRRTAARIEAGRVARST